MTTRILSVLAVVAGSLSAQVTCDTFAVATEIKGDELFVSIESDLPDDTRLSVSVSRRFRFRGDRRPRTAEYLVTYEDLSKWRKRRAIAIDDATWKKALEKAVEQRRYAGRSTEIDEEETSGTILLRIVVASNQPNQDFGAFNVKLSGKKVQDADGFKTVKLVRRLDLAPRPGGKAAPGGEVAPDALEPGRTYALTQAAPIYTHYDPAAGAAAVTRPRLERRCEVSVDRRVTHGGAVFYRVLASDPQSTRVAIGWLKASSLAAVEPRAAGGRKSRPRALAELERAWRLPPGFEPAWKGVGEPVADAGFTKARRMSFRITIPAGLERDAVADNLRDAAWHVLERWRADAVSVLAWRSGDATAGPATAGRAVLSAGGAWELGRAETPAVELKMTASVSERYFRPQAAALAAGTRCVLRKKGVFIIRLAKRAEDLEARELAAKVAAGTKATIHEVKRISGEEDDTVRYRVRTDGGQTGWIDASFVEAAR